MKAEEIIQELSKFELDQPVILQVYPGRKNYTEITHVNAEYDDYWVSFDTYLTYRYADLTTRNMVVEDVLQILKTETLDTISDSNFYDLELGTATDSGSPEFEDVEWQEDTPDYIREEADLWDLYFSGDIDSEHSFVGIQSLTIEVGDESYVLEHEEYPE